MDIIKEYGITRPIARAYEKIMDEKLLRELAFPFKSINHARAALDIGKGIKDADMVTDLLNNKIGRRLDVRKRTITDDVFNALYDRYKNLNNYGR